MAFMLTRLCIFTRSPNLGVIPGNRTEWNGDDRGAYPSNRRFAHSHAINPKPWIRLRYAPVDVVLTVITFGFPAAAAGDSQSCSADPP